MAKRVIAASFDSQPAAYAAARDIQGLDRDGVLTIERGAIATKDEKGNLTIPDTRNVGSAWGLLSGGIIGGLLGLLLGPAGAVVGTTLGMAGGIASDLKRLGVSEQFIRAVGSEIYPDQTVLLAELDEDATEPVDTVVTRHGGRIFRNDS